MYLNPESFKENMRTKFQVWQMFYHWGII